MKAVVVLRHRAKVSAVAEALGDLRLIVSRDAVNARAARKVGVAVADADAAERSAEVEGALVAHDLALAS